MSESISKETEPRGNLLFPRPCSRPVSSPSESPNWYRSAVFYEVLIQAFSDSNGDGIGDFQGLISRLVIWLGWGWIAYGFPLSILRLCAMEATILVPIRT